MSERLRPRPHAVLLSVAAAVSLGSAAVGAATHDSGKHLPPSSREELVKILGPKVERLGLRITELLAQGVRASNEAGDSSQVKLSVFVAKDLRTAPEFTDAFDRASAELQTQPTSSTQYR